jgi:cytochrome c oxidase accessory protein FixG
MTDKIKIEHIEESGYTVEHAETETFDLYKKREKIYTRNIKGFFQKLRLFTGWPLLVGYFFIPWINWGDRQAVLFDLPSRQFHIFGITFWPQDFVLLGWLLIISAFALFFITTWMGRVWCGYTCPQTVWTSIFMWIEQKTEGTRNARIKLDKAPWSKNKIIRKFLKHAMWAGFALITAVGFVGYFSPVRELVPAIFTFRLGPWEAFWLGFFTLTTYGNAGWLREQVCMYMCPYARFQSAMFDGDTLIVSYDSARGEKRGARKKAADYKSSGLGDCIDCQLCVQVCPTGIDIRDGLQYECINCALCVDACNDTMDKMGYERGLIRYTTENKLTGSETHKLRPKLVGYGVALAIMIGLFMFTITGRTPLQVDILRDRGQLYRQTDEGLIENSYTIKVLNMSQKDMQYVISVAGDENLALKGDPRVNVAAGEIYTVPVTVELDPAFLNKPNLDVIFTVTSTDKSVRASEESRFIGPITR